MKSRFQQKLPEEIELERMLAELACLTAQHAAALADLQGLRDEIARFERRYQQTLGRRIAELEGIEAEISRVTGCADEGNRQYRENCSEEAGGSREPAERKTRPRDREIKALYREVAKAIHPDLGQAGAAEVDRHELMARANLAYAQQDRQALQEILRKWQRSGDTPGCLDVAAELVRVIRSIARERQEILAVNAQVEGLKGSYLCRLKLRVDGSLGRGNDLFAEMVAAADLNIARARRRLADLTGGWGEQSAKASARELREICFPADGFLGTLYVRDRCSLDFSRWKKLGEARGCLQIDADQAVRLDVTAGAAVKLSQMHKLAPDDLQSLFLYEVSDRDLNHIVHLTGLEELYLSGRHLTDAALSGISSLTNLKRIFLYQTVITDRGLVHLQRLPGLKGLTSSGNSITEEGLAVFQKAIPGVKTVSFTWRYGRQPEVLP